MKTRVCLKYFVNDRGTVTLQNKGLHLTSFSVNDMKFLNTAFLQNNSSLIQFLKIK